MDVAVAQEVTSTATTVATWARTQCKLNRRFRYSFAADIIWYHNGDAKLIILFLGAAISQQSSRLTASIRAKEATVVTEAVVEVTAEAWVVTSGSRTIEAPPARTRASATVETRATTDMEAVKETSAVRAAADIASSKIVVSEATEAVEAAAATTVVAAGTTGSTKIGVVDTKAVKATGEATTTGRLPALHTSPAKNRPTKFRLSGQTTHCANDAVRTPAIRVDPSTVGTTTRVVMAVQEETATVVVVTTRATTRSSRARPSSRCPTTKALLAATRTVPTR